ncbi:MAG: DivIVA domain-containing protein [Bacillota bacterium]|nr:DivIVA domain-containing protein [Bacillota bacterium]
MDNKDTLTLTREDILQKQFTKNIKGYDPAEVDDFLDVVIGDYGCFLKFQEESKRYTDTLELENAKLKEKMRKLELENSRLQARLKGIKETDKVTTENIDLLQKIAKYEKFLYSQGYDVRSIK